MIKVVLIVLGLLIWNFSQNYWLSNVFIASDQVAEDTGNKTSGNPSANSTPATTEFGHLFGRAEQQPNQAPDSDKEELFAEKNQAYIGQLGNFQYILYATATVSGQVNAKLLVKDLELETVKLETVYKEQEFNQTQISHLSLSKLVMTQGEERIELKLFERTN